MESESESGTDHGVQTLKTALGFIGIGAMGEPMALNLLKAGHAMTVYARRAEAAATLVAAGARLAKSPAEVACAAGVVVTMVTTAADCEEVTLGKQGIIEGAARGSVVVDMATISPLAARRIAESLAVRGIEHVDAPVSGGPMGARDGTLSIMAGGKPQVFERIKPLFECMGKTILHMGDHGAGQVTKACNQLSLTVTLQGVAEAMNLAAHCGVDPAKVREAMLGGFAASRVLELFGKRMVERNFENGVDARFYHKDLNIVLGLMHELGLPAPAAAVTLQQINALVGSGGARSDFSRMIEVLERASASQ
jgi:3-hydroxyisobutyrate dehydrogenase-like beta-hydroxyacid dehydrogenase